MRYSEIINELFDPDKSFPLEWEDNYARTYDRQGRFIEIGFNWYTKPFDILEIDFTRGGSHAITGRGDASLVLGTVLEAIRQYLKNNHNADYIVFVAKEPSRKSLYSALVRKMAATLGYVHIPTEMVPGDLMHELDPYNADKNGMFVLKRRSANLSEALQSAYPYERTMDGAAFRVNDGGKVFVSFDDMNIGRTYDVRAVSFYKETASHRRTFDMTGEGDAFKILATVMAATKEWAQQARPQVITLSSENRRGRLAAYRHMIQRAMEGSRYRLVDSDQLDTQLRNRMLAFELKRMDRNRDHQLFYIVRQDLLEPQISESKRRRVKEQGLTFMGYPCTRDCSGHSAGYDWANRMNIKDAGDCPYGNSNSFWEGCKSKSERK
jgi:hypothetical protein